MLFLWINHRRLLFSIFQFLRSGSCGTETLLASFRRQLHVHQWTREFWRPLYPWEMWKLCSWDMIIPMTSVGILMVFGFVMVGALDTMVMERRVGREELGSYWQNSGKGRKAAGWELRGLGHGSASMMRNWARLMSSSCGNTSYHDSSGLLELAYWSMLYILSQFCC